MTLTYVYSDQTAVLGPLSTTAEPHAYDLCEQHSERLSAPRGWEVLRLASVPTAPVHSDDDLLALADAVREAAVRPATPATRPPHVVPHERGTYAEEEPRGTRTAPGGRPDRGERRGHLRVLETDPTPR